MVDYYRAVRRVINGIEQQLQRTQLWESEPPPDDDLASREPFSYDTLPFHRWLQWLFIPRMRTILAGHGHMPTSSDILPYATDCLRDCPEDVGQLLFLIQTFDELITGHAAAGETH